MFLGFSSLELNQFYSARIKNKDKSNNCIQGNKSFVIKGEKLLTQTKKRRKIKVKFELKVAATIIELLSLGDTRTANSQTRFTKMPHLRQ